MWSIPARLSLQPSPHRGGKHQVEFSMPYRTGNQWFDLCRSQQYKEMEQKVKSALEGLTGELAGTYYPLTGMTKEDQNQLIADHFLFKEGDR